MKEEATAPEGNREKQFNKGKDKEDAEDKEMTSKSQAQS